MLDNEVPEDMIVALKLYCDAFFTGCNIQIKKPGDEWDTGKHLPQDFIAENKICTRMNCGDKQAYTEAILKKLL